MKKYIVNFTKSLMNLNDAKDRWHKAGCTRMNEIAGQIMMMYHVSLLKNDPNTNLT